MLGVSGCYSGSQGNFPTQMLYVVVVTFPEGQKRECVRGYVGKWLDLEGILCPGKGRTFTELSRSRKSKCFSSLPFFIIQGELKTVVLQ